MKRRSQWTWVLLATLVCTNVAWADDPPQPPEDCNDGITCTIDTWDEGSQSCIHTPNDAVCDDGFWCDGEEWCSPTYGCMPGTPIDCDDSISCTTDFCDELHDVCLHSPHDGLCDDDLWCNGEEWCSVTNDCMPGTPVDCDDGITCTTDVCDEENDVCVNTPDDDVCDNGLWCDGEEWCSPEHGCMPGTPVDCDDGITCTIDICDEANDVCVSTPDDDVCDNGLWCDGIEICDPYLGCLSGDEPCSVDEVCYERNDTCGVGAISCSSHADCIPDFSDPCVYYRCNVFGVCEQPQRRTLYGDACGTSYLSPPNGAVNMTDLMCILDSNGNLSACPHGDIAGSSALDCEPNGIINLTDIIAILDVLNNDPACDCP